MAFAAMRAAALVYEPQSPPWPDRSPERVDVARYRIGHLQRTDPDGAWVAVAGDEVVGMSLSLRRGPLWLLSLLAVSTDQQSRGTGRALLDASLRSADGADAAWILSTTDPKALRRYALAGFAPHAGYAAVGPLDRALLPGSLDVRDGEWSRDGELVDDVMVTLRGAPYGRDIEAMAAIGQRLMVIEDGADRGFVTTRGGAVFSLGGTTPGIATQLLWAALAASESPTVSVDWLTADQQWAIDVALAARLPLLAGPSWCRRTTLGTMSPYLPSGAYG